MPWNTLNSSVSQVSNGEQEADHKNERKQIIKKGEKNMCMLFLDTTFIVRFQASFFKKKNL